MKKERIWLTGERMNWKKINRPTNVGRASLNPKSLYILDQLMNCPNKKKETSVSTCVITYIVYIYIYIYGIEDIRLSILEYRRREGIE